MADRRGIARTRVAASFLAGLLAFGFGACVSTPAASPAVVPTVAPTPPATLAATQPAATATEAVTPTSSAAAGVQACSATDLKASHDLVEGAAGSRLTTVVLSTASVCSVDLYPAIGLRDAGGTELVGGASAGQGQIDIGPSVTYSSAIRFANWCSPDPKFPLSLVLRIGAGEVGVTGSSFPDEGDMPPCNGGAGPMLEAGQWEGAP